MQQWGALRSTTQSLKDRKAPAIEPSGVCIHSHSLHKHTDPDITKYSTLLFILNCFKVQRIQICL